MLALVGTVMSRSPSGNVLLRDGDGVLGTHTPSRSRRSGRMAAPERGAVPPAGGR